MPGYQFLSRFCYLTFFLNHHPVSFGDVKIGLKIFTSAYTRLFIRYILTNLFRNLVHLDFFYKTYQYLLWRF